MAGPTAEVFYGRHPSRRKEHATTRGYIMSISVLRTSGAWWVALHGHRAVPVETTAR
jgi:hypothetical protein